MPWPSKKSWDGSFWPLTAEPSVRSGINSWADLQIQHDILEETRVQGRRIQDIMSKKATKLDGSKRRIDAACANPVIARLLESQIRARRMHESGRETNQEVNSPNCPHDPFRLHVLHRLTSRRRSGSRTPYAHPPKCDSPRHTSRP